MKCRVLPVAILALLACAVLHPPAAAAVPAGVPLAWGRNDYGQLGNGTLIDTVTPGPVSNLAGVVSVAGGNYHSLALKADGTVWAWGWNAYGQLGNGTFADSNVPGPVSNLAGVVAVGGGGYTSVALKADGTAWAWGDNTYGQLGIGVFGGSRTTPVQVSSLSGVVSITGGGSPGSFTLALKADGTVWAWGYNDSGQLGDGTFTSRSKPVRVTNLPGVIEIGACTRHGLALAPNGTVWAWGRNDVGQLGNGTFTLAPPYGIPTPAPVSNLSGVVAIVGRGSTGGNYSTALKADGTVWTWGRNQAGQLGRGTITADTDPTNTLPAPVVNPDGTVFDNVVAVALGAGGGRAIKSDGGVWGWGANDEGQFGTGTVGPPSPNPVLIPGVVAPVALGTGLGYTLVVDIAAPYSLQLQQPVNVDGTSVFKKSSTVELKFKLTGANAGITDAQARFGYAQIDGSNPGNVNESQSNAAGTPGILFQYDAASEEYRYNWRTTGLGTGRYLVRIDLGDGVTRTVVVGLK